MSSPIKVMFVLADALNPNIGGVQRVTCNLGPQFADAGVSVAYFSFMPTGHAPIDKGTLFSVPKAGKVKTAENQQFLMKVLEEWHPDIVINQMPYVSEIWPLLSQAREQVGFKLLGCLHNSLFSVVNNVREFGLSILPKPLFFLMDNKIGMIIMLALHRIKHAKALRGILGLHDRFILLTPPNKEELRYFLGEFPEEKVLVIPNSINLEGRTAAAAKEKVVLHVGRLNDGQKRSDLLLEVWRNCCLELDDWKFYIVGDGPYMAKLEAEIEEHQIPRVYLEGYQTPDDYFAKAALFVMPSAYEGFPNTILEAQSYGCVVLAFNSYPAVEWIVNDQKDALLSTPYDTTQMAQQLIELARSVDKRAKIQEAAQMNAMKFSLPNITEKWLKLFNNIVK